MLNEDESKIVTAVFNRFLEGEGTGSDCSSTPWDTLDDQLQALEHLDDDQIHREADVQLYHHSKGAIHCGQENCSQDCFARTVVDAATYICYLYKKTGNLHKNNRYVLVQYLSLSQLGMILSEAK